MMNDIFEQWWESSADARQLRVIFVDDPAAITAMKLSAGLAWNKALDMAKAIVIYSGRE